MLNINRFNNETKEIINLIINCWPMRYAGKNENVQKDIEKTIKNLKRMRKENLNGILSLGGSIEEYLDALAICEKNKELLSQAIFSSFIAEKKKIEMYQRFQNAKLGLIEELLERKQITSRTAQYLRRWKSLGKGSESSFI